MREKAKHLSYFFYKDTAWDLYVVHEINVMFVRSSLIYFSPAPREKKSCDSSGPCKVKKNKIFNSGKRKKQNLRLKLIAAKAV